VPGKHRVRRAKDVMDMHPDKGCDLAASCLRCPFTYCRYDAMPGSPVVQVEKPGMSKLRQEIVTLFYERHMSVEEIAVEVGRSERSVHRNLQEARSRALTI